MEHDSISSTTKFSKPLHNPKPMLEVLVGLSCSDWTRWPKARRAPMLPVGDLWTIIIAH